MTADKMIEILECVGVNEDIIDYVVCVYGKSEEDLSNILYWDQGYKDFEQFAIDYGFDWALED